MTMMLSRLQLCEFKSRKTRKRLNEEHLMRPILAVTAAVLLATLPLYAQQPGPIQYKLDFDPQRDVTQSNRDDKGRPGLFITVRFTISLEGDKQTDDPTAMYKVIVEEDGQKVHEDDVPRPSPSEDLGLVMVLDTSGSMKEHGRMAQAKAAAEVFLDKLPAKADCGLILFDHEIREPVLSPTPNRNLLREQIRAVEPRGGTAYLDAAARAVRMLVPQVGREKAVVVLTDGLDLNSQATVDQVIQLARKSRVRVYTVGIGEPGKLEPVNSVLVLDRSGSMHPPADDQDRVSKIKALHRAAARFVTIMPGTAQTTLLPFSTEVGIPKSLSGNKKDLIAGIERLTPEGETALFDATYAAIATLDTLQPRGKRAVVAMTDGIDNSSRRRVDEVIERAKEAKISLYMLGFGRPGELDEEVMKQMAEQTGGRYYHAKNEKALLDIFENLSILLHDDGIDEVTLQNLARHTGGQYYHARKVGDLRFILEQVTESIQKKSYEVTFKSLRQVSDGTARRVTLKLVRRGGELASNPVAGDIRPTDEVLQKQEGGYQTPGVVIAEMNYLVYLSLLGVLIALLALPAIVRKRLKGTAA
jgi:VWFA-related protein